MAKELIYNGQEISAKAENIKYANSSRPNISNAKAALDDLYQNSGSQGSGTAPIKMAVLGDSTATDLPSGGQGVMSYHNKVSIFKWLARYLNPSAYHNIAGHGNVLATMYGSNIGAVPQSVNTIFILIGINNINTGVTESYVGRAATVMEYAINNAKGDAIDVAGGETMTSNGYDARLKNSLIGYYRLCLDYLRKRCGTECKIYVVSPLFNNSRDSSSSALRPFLKQFREELHLLTNAMNEAENTSNYIYISGLLLGVDSSNQQTMYADGSHPNDTGSEFIAKNIIGAMRGFRASPSFTASPGSVDFGDVQVGTTATATVQVSGFGWYKYALKTYGGQSAEFTLSTQALYAQDGQLDATNITITFRPASAGDKSTYVLVNDYNRGGYMTLTGKGVSND